MQYENDLKLRVYKFSIEIMKFCNALPNEKVYWVVTNQLMRSGTSIGANIIEAKGASSRKDFIKFYQISLKSANETKYWLGLLRDATNADKEKVFKLLNEADELSKIVASCLISLKGKKRNF